MGLSSVNAYIFLVLWFYLSGEAFANPKIVLAMDLRHNLHPRASMKHAANLFEYHHLTDSAEPVVAPDIIAHANWTSLHRIYKSFELTVPGNFANSHEVMDLAEDKAAWKKWMHSVGLGSYVPMTYNNSAPISSFEYPLVLKTNAHFARGVTGPDHLQELVANITKQGNKYTLEEALTGMGQWEAASFGSAYQGKLQSLLCIARRFARNSGVERSLNAQHSQAGSVNMTSTLFIKGFAAKPQEEQFIPCSQELVNVTAKMVRLLNYTGPFCTNIKADKNLAPKMMEINARFCGPMAWNEPLFLGVFVPLAFAAVNGTVRVRELMTGTHFRHDLYHILNTTSVGLRTGGGLYQNKELTVAKFDHTLRLDPIQFKSKPLPRKTSRERVLQ